MYIGVARNLRFGGGSQSLEVLKKAIEHRDLDPLLENVLTKTINEMNEYRGNTTLDGEG